MYGIWFNGNFHTPAGFSLSINDLGLLRGYGLFDYFRTYHKKAFQWDWYWARFEYSAAQMGIDKKIDKETCKSIVDQLIGQSPGDDVAIRILLTGGFSENSVEAAESNLFIISEPLRTTPESKYDTGLILETRNYMRDMPEVKTTDYKFLLKEKKESVADDFLYCHEGFVYELSRSNIFIVKNKTLITPTLGVLKGISRKLVLELSDKHYAIEERAVGVNELFTADEVFTTSSTKQVLGITQIDNRPIGNKKPGEVTLHLRSLFQAFIEENYA